MLTPASHLLVLKNKILISSILLFNIATLPSITQDVTTITVKSEDISDTMDLEAVASIFEASKDLENFEKRLNDPKTQVSNLDLNNDGEVDYLRIITNQIQGLAIVLMLQDHVQIEGLRHDQVI